MCVLEPVAEPTPPPAQNKVVIPLPEQSENVTRWIVDQSFRKEQERLKIPLGSCKSELVDGLIKYKSACGVLNTCKSTAGYLEFAKCSNMEYLVVCRS